MVQKTFGIYNPETNSGNEQFYLELGNSHVAIWLKDSQSNVISSFELFEYDAEMTPILANVIRDVKTISKIAKDYHPQVQVIWENSECLLVPTPYYEEKVSPHYLNIVFGNALHAEVAGQNNTASQTAAVFRVPKSWKEAILQYYPNAGFEHKYLGLFNSFTTDKQGLYAFFYRNHFILVVVKDRKVQLMQTFNYQTPEDVLYYILNTCNQYGLDYEKTPVRVAGLIDFKSSLYEEMVKYLPDVAVDTLPGNKVGKAFSDQPVHYFVPFFKTTS
ncbi:Protein of unknown function [Filimonas lacunae]|uniref:DUF3822 domain-containing protein n=1 Tax=Filimonas lacunae TaxID=477680 RepID=A0A173MGJ2_9BACT|nr:DUF3822 family protein [Filimonas lacunae]BAV06538.1 hypothetical protein FLA_2557 [Filimonas lacunae]SIT27312.1 Protein of unknown function [Filimonas lacunae]